jgi:hypothetical protein
MTIERYCPSGNERCLHRGTDTMLCRHCAETAIVELRAERDALAERWEHLRGNVDACKQDHTYGDGSGFALTVLDWMRELEAQK